MSSLSYTITDVDLDAGYISVHIQYPDGFSEDVNYEMKSVVASDDATEALIRSALDQLVYARYEGRFPPPQPKPAAANGLLGQTYQIEGVTQ